MITVVGAGAIGSVISEYLARENDVSVVDLDRKKLEGLRNVRKLVGTIQDHEEVIRESDAVVVALPGSVAYKVVKNLLEKGSRVVDISFSDEDPFNLEETAQESGGLLVPDAGFAPGLSNLLAGRLHSESKYSRIEIYVAGLPQERKPPLQYSVTWSVEGLIDEYTRPARIVRNGKQLEIDPLGETTCFSIEELGEFEAFYSDGLRTLLRSMPGIDLFEKTLRYGGHIEKVRLLRDLGYLSDTLVSGIPARKLTESLLERTGTGEKDFTVLIVRGIGRENREFFCLDRYDEKSGISSMSRMTGYTAAVIAEAIVQGKIHGKGVIAPETLGYDDEVFSFIREKLAASGIRF